MKNANLKNKLFYQNQNEVCEIPFVITLNEVLYFYKGEQIAMPLQRQTQNQELAEKDNEYKSPMPGKIFKVNFKNGDSVKSDEVILILEAMKMEHAIKANSDGVLKNLNKKVMDFVEHGEVLFEIDQA